MLRLTRLIRIPNISRKMIRGGGGWDRPDVPPTVTPQYDKLISMQQTQTVFFDQAMNEYLLTQIEVYEETPAKASKTFFSLFTTFFVGLGSIVLACYLFAPLKDNRWRSSQTRAAILKNKQRLDKKIGLQYAKSNPFGIEVAAQRYPQNNGGKHQLPSGYQAMLEDTNVHNTMKKEASLYIQNLKEQARKKVQKKSQGGHQEHDSHHH